MFTVHALGSLLHEIMLSDPLYWICATLASNCVILVELGIMPIITLDMIIQLLVSANLIEIDFSLKEDRALFGAAQKCQ